MDKLLQANQQYSLGHITFEEFRNKIIYTLMEFTEKDCLTFSSVLDDVADQAE